MENQKLKSGFNEQGLLFSVLLLFAALVSFASLLHSSSKRIDMHWTLNAHLAEFVAVTGVILLIGLFGVTQFVTFSTRPLWHRSIVGSLLLGGSLYLLTQWLPVTSTQRVQLTILGNLGIDRSWLMVPGGLIVVSLFTGSVLRLLGNVQLKRWRLELMAQQYATETKIGRTTLIVFGCVLLSLYVIANNTNWLNFAQFFPSELSFELTLGFGVAAVSGLLLHLPTAVAAWFRNSWLAFILAAAFSILVTLVPWLIIEYGKFGFIENLVAFQILDPSLRKMAWIGTGVYLGYLWVLFFSSTLPFAYTISLARRWNGESQAQDRQPKERWLVLPLTVVGLLVLGWLIPDVINQKLSVPVFAASDRSLHGWSDAVLAADLMRFQPTDLPSEEENSFWISDGFIQVNDSIVVVRPSVDSVKRPEWPELQRRINLIQPPPAINLAGQVSEKHLVYPGQMSCDLDGRSLSLDDVPLIGAPQAIRITDSAITPKQLTRFSSQVTFRFERCQFYWDEQDFSIFQFNRTHWITCTNCDFDKAGLIGMMSLNSHFRFDSLEKLESQPLGMWEAVYASRGIQLPLSPEVDVWRQKYPSLRSGGENRGYTWLQMDLHDPYKSLPEKLPGSFTSPGLLADSDGNPCGFQFDSVHTPRAFDLIKKHKPAYLVTSSNLDTLSTQASQDPELVEALKHVRYYGCNQNAAQADLLETLELFPDLEVLALGRAAGPLDIGVVTQDLNIKKLLFDIQILTAPQAKQIPDSVEAIYADQTTFTGTGLPAAITSKIRPIVWDRYQQVDLLTLLEMSQDQTKAPVDQR